MGTDDRSGADADALASCAVTNLRGVFILVLLAFHSSLAYLSSAPASPQAFDAAPYSWLAFPVVDQRRFFGFDLYCAWEDAQVMALMFFLSGLFVPESLRRKGPARFAGDRFLRLGVPFLFGVLMVAPLALYPVFHRLNPTADVADYLGAYLKLPFLPNGPPWFLWLLLALSLALAALEALKPGALKGLAGIAAGARERPGRFLAILGGAAALAYVPLALRYGPFDWYEQGPFSFQESRPLLYGVFFLAGAAVGGAGLGRGLLAPNAALVQRWRLLAGISLAALFVWMGMMGAVLTYPTVMPLTLSLLAALAYVAASVTGVMFLLAATMRFGAKPIRWLGPLSRNALGVFVLHYPAMVWTQSALTEANLPALVKAGIVFVVALSSSLALAAAMRRTPGLALLIGQDLRPPAPVMRAASAPGA